MSDRRQLFKAALEGDAAYFHEAGAKAVAELLVATETGMSQERFADEARRFIEKDRLVVWRLPEIEAINDKEGKPVGIDRHIGRRPIFVAGNVGNYGDIDMMQYSKGRRGASFQLLINHDDAAREFAYAEKDNASLNAAKEYGFIVANIKSDWETVFSLGKAASSK